MGKVEGMVPSEEYTFISYAEEDEIQAERLCTDLEGYGVSCWLWKKHGKPGQDMDIACEEALRNAAFCIVLLSNVRNNKKGYVHVEEILAIEQHQRQPVSMPFLIPARLEKCDYPQRLRRIHTVDLFPDWEAGLLLILRTVTPEGQRTRQEINAILQSPADRTRSAQRLVLNHLYASGDSPVHFNDLRNSCIGPPLDASARTPSFFNQLYTMASSGVVRIESEEQGQVSVELTPLARRIVSQSLYLNIGSEGLDT